MVKSLPFYILKAAGIFLVFLLLFSCRDSNRKNRIPEGKFINLLVDLHLGNAIVSEKRSLKITYQLDSASMYGSIFGKYDVTRAQFDSTMLYYSEKPEDFQKVFNKVTAKLKQMEKDVVAEEELALKDKMDVIWQDSQIHNLPLGSGDRLKIDIPINQTGFYTVSATVRLFPGDASLNPRMSVYFYYDDNTPAGNRVYFDEVYYRANSGKPGSYSATKQLIDPKVTHIRGFIANYSNADSLFRRDIVISAIKVTRSKEGAGDTASPE
jgi:hypothetical protein